MIVWLALLVPIVTVAVLYFFYKHDVVIWEFLIPFAVSIVLIGVAQLILIHSQTSDVEYWGGIVTKAEYYEDWNERVPCSHPTYCESCSTDSNGNRTCTSYQCGWDHPYDVDYHPEYWRVVNTNGESIRISKGKYHQLVRKFGNKKFVDLHRDYHTDDGDKYLSKWPETPETADITTTKHTYENRVMASRSVFNFPEVDPRDIRKYGLYTYPAIQGHYTRPAILGGGSMKAQRKFQLINGYMGRSQQLRVWVLLFKNQPRDAGHLQEALWVGANKNEFVITIGVDNQYNVEWSHVFSWTEAERLKIDTRYYVEEQESLDLVALADWLKPRLRKQWDRREFAEFDYLKVEPPTWAVVLIFFLTILANIGVSAYVVMNQFKESSWNRESWRR